MNYTSTRNRNITIHSADAIARGLSPDGGLFAPTEIPELTQCELSALCREDYSSRAAYIIGKFLDDFSPEELEEFCAKAYSKDKFGDAPAPVHALNDHTSILELWHGPTAAFKDMALQILPYLLVKSLEKTGEKRKVCILVATSGDTGKAALEGFADVPGTCISVFYPTGGVSRVQEIQMTTQKGANVYVSGVHGNFDDVQTKVKEIFADPAAAERLTEAGCFFSSANSINWGRAVPQVVYYISGYCDLVNSGAIKLGDEINICVPTGNFGNILAAYYAKCMGLPVKKLICASNQNRILTDFFETGTYDRRREFYLTNSPAMDILVSSNFERLLFHMTGGTVTGYMDALKRDGFYSVPSEIKERMDEEFAAGSASQEETLTTIAKTWKDNHYLIDTHTAVGLGVYEKYAEATGDRTHTLIASTASPFKFCDSVITALTGNKTTGAAELVERLEALTGVDAPKPLKGLDKLNERFNGKIERDEILETVYRFLNA